MIAIIDWFATKIGMLIFLAVVLSLLLGFASMQMSAFAHEQKVRMAEDIARLIDVAGSGGYVEYEPKIDDYTLIINQNSVELDGIEEYFKSNAAPTQIKNAKLIKIENKGGTVYVSEG